MPEPVLILDSRLRNKLIFMPIDRIGKLLYPRLLPWERRRKIIRFIWAVLGVIALAVTVVVISFKKNSIGR